MKIISTSIPDLLIIQPQVFGDQRGYLYEAYNKHKFQAQGLELDFVQDNISKSDKNVVRGLHFQKPPYAQGKLVSVLRGAVIDIGLDIRRDSPTYGQHHAVLLSEENKTRFWVPPGFAHGFVTLEDETIFAYKCTDFYYPEAEGAILWNDPLLNIDWQVSDPILSQRDQAALPFSEFESPFIYGQY